MTSEKPDSRFGLDAGRTSFTMRDVEKVRDQDNVQLVPKPSPAIFRLDRPNLAPPGMKGITRSVRTNGNVDININLNVRIDESTRRRPTPVSDIQCERLRLGDQGNARKAFKPLALGQPSDKGERDR